MKTNEAPEYLYYAPYGDLREDSPITDNDIEYIRKDAFIEKARKWFEECFMNVHKWEISTYEFENIQSMIDEFRKYMEEE